MTKKNVPWRPADAIFPKSGRAAAIANQKCIPEPIGCGRPLNPFGLGFRDEASFREYHISGLCQECQDELFSE